MKGLDFEGAFSGSPRKGLSKCAYISRRDKQIVLGSKSQYRTPDVETQYLLDFSSGAATSVAASFIAIPRSGGTSLHCYDVESHCSVPILMRLPQERGNTMTGYPVT
jgi:hypothetical protein